MSTSRCGPARNRRVDDWTSGVLLAAAPSAVASGLHGGDAGYFEPFSDGESPDDLGSRSPLVLLDRGIGDLLCVMGGELRRIKREPRFGLAKTVESVAESFRQRRSTARRKQQFHDTFVVFVEHTNRASSPLDIFEALLRQTPDLLNVYAAALYFPQAGASSGNLHPFTDSRIATPLTPIPAAGVFPRPCPWLISASEAQPGLPFAALAPLFRDLGAHHLACVAIGGRGLLVLVERRAAREFSGEDWFRIQTIARHTDCVLERLHLSALLRSAKTPSKPTPASSVS